MNLADAVTPRSSFDPCLSGLRGVAAFGVVLFHACTVLGFLYPLFLPLSTGVSLFLMLSIFLLLRSLDNNPSLGHYFFRRIRRIWPIYYLTITGAFLLYHFTLGNSYDRGI